MRTIQNYVLGNWITGDGEGQALYNAVTGGMIARATSKGLDFGAILDYARKKGNPALREMSFHTDKQNADLRKFVKDNPSAMMSDNIELCEKLGIDLPVELDIQNYNLNNINVYLNQNAS